MTAAPDVAPAVRSARPSLLTAAGRDRLATWALLHPRAFLLWVYAASRLLVLLALAIAARWFQNPAGVGHLQAGIGDMFLLWDADWYASIAQDGYPVPLPTDAQTGRITYSEWAFYPVFPLLTRPLMALGVPFGAAAVAVNLVLGALAVLLVWRVCRFGLHAAPQPARERLALCAAALWCLYPATATMLVPYTEALAAVLVAGALLLLMERHYLLTALLAVVLGFTRGVAPALACVVLVHLTLRWREDRAARVTPLGGQRAAAATLLVATGASALAWPAYAAWRTGVPTAFFDVQASWGMKPSQGPFVLWLDWAWSAWGVAGIVVMVALVATYLALVAGRHGRWLPVEVRTWALVYPLYLIAVVRPITSMWRFLLLDFPIAALLASVAMRTSTGERVVRHWRRRVLVVVLALVGGLVWWTATLWVYTPWGSATP
ncbi:hypothetical protein ACQP1U_05070 [Actinomycetota bacterium]